MLVSSISQITNTNFQHKSKQKKGFRSYVSWSGYGAVGLGVASGIAGHYKKIKLHKNLAYASAALTLFHVGIVEWNKFQYKQKMKENAN